MPCLYMTSLEAEHEWKRGASKIEMQALIAAGSHLHSSLASALAAS